MGLHSPRRITWRKSARDYLWKYRSSTFPLIAANVLPLLGIVFFQWSVFAVVMLFWAENLVIGAINVLKMASCQPTADLLTSSRPGRSRSRRRVGQNRSGGLTAVAHHAQKLFMIPFFIFHYGMFCQVHGAFLFTFFGDDDAVGRPFFSYQAVWQQFKEDGLLWGVAVLATSHLISFVVNFLWRGEYKRTTAPAQMMKPYIRIVPLHVALIFGGFFVIMLGSPVAVLLLLVAGKTILDLGFHVFEHEISGKREAEA